MANRKLRVNTNIQVKSFEVSVPAAQSAGEETSIEITFPIDINLIRGSFFNKPEFLGDIARMYIAEGTTIGVVTAAASIGDEWLNVNETVIENIERGYYVKINGIALGRALEIDEANSRIRVAAIGAEISAMDYLQITIKFVPHIYLEGTNNRELIEGGVEPSFIAADTPIKITYVNNNLAAKTFSLRFEYHY